MSRDREDALTQQAVRFGVDQGHLQPEQTVRTGAPPARQGRAFYPEMKLNKLRAEVHEKCRDEGYAVAFHTDGWVALQEPRARSWTAKATVFRPPQRWLEEHPRLKGKSRLTKANIVAEMVERARERGQRVGGAAGARPGRRADNAAADEPRSRGKRPAECADISDAESATGSNETCSAELPRKRHCRTSNGSVSLRSQESDDYGVAAIQLLQKEDELASAAKHEEGDKSIDRIDNRYQAFVETVRMCKADPDLNKHMLGLLTALVRSGNAKVSSIAEAIHFSHHSGGYGIDLRAVLGSVATG